MLLVLLYLHNAPHPAPSNTPHHLPSVVRSRVLMPLCPSMFLTPLLMYCAATFRSSRFSQSTLPHLHVPHAPPHIPHAPPHIPRAPMAGSLQYNHRENWGSMKVGSMNP